MVLYFRSGMKSYFQCTNSGDRPFTTHTSRVKLNNKCKTIQPILAICMYCICSDFSNQQSSGTAVWIQSVSRWRRSVGPSPETAPQLELQGRDRTGPGPGPGPVGLEEPVPPSDARRQVQAAAPLWSRLWLYRTGRLTFAKLPGPPPRQARHCETPTGFCRPGRTDQDGRCRGVGRNRAAPSAG